MSRLTHRNENGEARVWLYSDPKNMARVLEEQKRKEVEVLEKLAHYEDLEEAGRFILLPCELREEVWVAHELVAPFKKRFTRKSMMLDWIEQGYVIGYTKAEAEAKMAELQKGE